MLQCVWPQSQTQHPVKSIWDSSGYLHSLVVELISLNGYGKVLHGVSPFGAISVYMETLICNPDKLSILVCDVHTCERLGTLICLSMHE